MADRAVGRGEGAGDDGQKDDGCEGEGDEARDKLALATLAAEAVFEEKPAQIGNCLELFSCLDGGGI